MVGTLLTPTPGLAPAPARSSVGNSAAGSSAWTPSVVNSLRVSTVVDRLALHVCNPPKDDVLEFFNLCLSLARGIDYAVANNEIPSKVQDLPKLLKQVCHRKNLLLQAAIMVLMVSVKSACKIGWFSNEDSTNLLTLADEVASNFISIRDMNTDGSHSHQIISTIMERFCPSLKMGQTLSFLEVKSGYGTYLADFHIPKNVKPSPEEKVRLFVAQTDNIETSSCLNSPPQVNFLINGKGVMKRTNVFVESGPQLPTIVTHMLKYGTNILQVVGQFTGNYVVAIVYMSVISSPERPALQDYVQPEVAVQDQDSEIIEGPSRISLNCPISFRRIKTPVKGYSCKHLQCFDFDNFVGINSRRPSWRCPHCNQCVSYVDIRINRSMVKVLEEVGEGVAEVIISADGSWKPVLESNKNLDHERTPGCQQDEPALPIVSSNSNAPLDVMDLTEGDDDVDVPDVIDMEDQKPILVDVPIQVSGFENSTVASVMNNANVVNQNDGHMEDDFWSRMLLSTFPFERSSSGSDSQMFGALSGSALGAMQSQPPQFVNALVSSEYGTDASITRPRIPVAVQALPAQSPASTPQQRLVRNNSIDAVTSQISATPSIADGSHPSLSALDRHMQMFRSQLNSQLAQMNPSHPNPLQLSQTNPSLLWQQPVQNWHHQNHPLISSQLPQPSIPPSTPLPSSSPRVSPHAIAEHQNSHQQLPIPPLNLRIPQGMVQSTNPMRSSTFSQRNSIPPASTLSGITHSLSTPQQMPSAQRTNHVAAGRQLQPPRASTSGPTAGDGIRALMGEQLRNIVDSSQLPSGTSTDGSSPTEQNWRPSGRMRGALQGQAYSAALQQYIFQPTQPIQATRPPMVPLPLPSLNLLIANTRNAHVSQGVPNPSTEATGMFASSAVEPDPTTSTQEA